MKHLLAEFRQGLITGAAMFISLWITPVSVVAVVAVWCVAYVVCWCIFVVTELVNFKPIFDDWHPDEQLKGYEPHTWWTLTMGTFEYWVNLLTTRIENILK